MTGRSYIAVPADAQSKCAQNSHKVLSNRKKISSFYMKSWSQNTLVRAVFRPEAGLTLFLRMRTKNRQNIAKMYSDRRVIPLLHEIGVDEANGEVRFLT